MSPKPKFHKAAVSDIYGVFENDKYPRGTPGDGKHRFDFIFTKKGRWVYMSSHDDPKKLREVLSAPVEAQKERWRVVEYHTGLIVLSS